MVDKQKPTMIPVEDAIDKHYLLDIISKLIETYKGLLPYDIKENNSLGAAYDDGILFMLDTLQKIILNPADDQDKGETNA